MDIKKDTIADFEKYGNRVHYKPHIPKDLREIFGPVKVRAKKNGAGRTDLWGKCPICKKEYVINGKDNILQKNFKNLSACIMVHGIAIKTSLEAEVKERVSIT